jgi:hypothetical protein
MNAVNFCNPAKANRSTYIACLKCGAEFAYDWERMRVEARQGLLRAER